MTGVDPSGTRHDPSVTRRWVQAGTARFVEAAVALSDDQVGTPSRLPGWTCAHVIGHVARNAEAIARLVHWADTGVETPMYADAGQRRTEIDSTATVAPAELRELLTCSAASLEDAWDRLSPAAWRAEVRTAQGRVVPALELPWMRTREVWLHTCDLNAGTAISDFPPDLVDTLAADILAVLATRKDCPGVNIRILDRPNPWRLGSGGGASVAGTAAAVVGWLAGRSGGEGVEVAVGDLPILPAWL